MWRCAVFLAVWLVSTACHAGGVIIGPFCVDDATVQLSRNDVTWIADGRWTAVVYTERAAHGRGSLLAVFRSPPQLSSPKETCEDVVEHETAASNAPLLVGYLERMDAHGYVFRTSSNASTNRLQIDAGSFHARLGRVVQGQLAVAGGSVQLSGSKLWITNSQPILVEASKISGEFEIEAWNRRIENAQVTVGGVPLGPILLVPTRPNRENTAFHFDLGSGATTLWNGTLSSDVGSAFATNSVTMAGLLNSRTLLHVPSGSSLSQRTGRSPLVCKA